MNNDNQGFEQLSEWLKTHGCDRSTTILCMENTGIYDDRLLEAVQTGGWACAVEKTTVLDKVTPEHHRKEDAYDPTKLAEYADLYSNNLHLYRAPHNGVEGLRQLVAEKAISSPTSGSKDQTNPIHPASDSQRTGSL